jgi:hypothetical protein
MLLLEPMKGDYRAEMVQRKRLILETCGFGDLVEMYRLGFVETPQPPVQTKRKRNAPCFAVADEKPELEDSKKHKQQQQQQQQQQQHSICSSLNTLRYGSNHHSRRRFLLLSLS